MMLLIRGVRLLAGFWAGDWAAVAGWRPVRKRATPAMRRIVAAEARSTLRAPRIRRRLRINRARPATRNSSRQ